MSQRYEIEYRFFKVGPRWWQLRWRFVMWRWRRSVARERAKLPLPARTAAEDMARDIERRFFLGDDYQSR